MQGPQRALAGAGAAADLADLEPEDEANQAGHQAHQRGRQARELGLAAPLWHPHSSGSVGVLPSVMPELAEGCGLPCPAPPASTLIPGDRACAEARSVPALGCTGQLQADLSASGQDSVGATAAVSAVHRPGWMLRSLSGAAGPRSVRPPGCQPQDVRVSGWHRSCWMHRASQPASIARVLVVDGTAERVKPKHAQRAASRAACPETEPRAMAGLLRFARLASQAGAQFEAAGAAPSLILRQAVSSLAHQPAQELLDREPREPLVASPFDAALLPGSLLASCSRTPVWNSGAVAAPRVVPAAAGNQRGGRLQNPEQATGGVRAPA